ncbi:MAG: hypothetical protein H0U70_08275 [Tatlockia sp.]|nr:hypothetical protein [Tatlockia sp.]
MKVKIGRHREILTEPAKAGQKGSYLPDETPFMEKNRREQVQKGHGQFAKVNVVEHFEPQQSSAPEGEPQNDVKEHPWLDSQRNDGIDPNENPEPAINSAARTDFDNAKREQDLEHKLRLGLMPNTAPKPPNP